MALFKKHRKDALSGDEGDAAMVERYEYLLATAQPDMLNRIHIEAFEMLSVQSRAEVFKLFTDSASSPDQAPLNSEPDSLARFATDAEVMRPGSLLRLLGGPAIEIGGKRTPLAAVAAVVTASPIAIALFPYRYGRNASFWGEVDDEFDA